MGLALLACCSQSSPPRRPKKGARSWEQGSFSRPPISAPLACCQRTALLPADGGTGLRLLPSVLVGKRGWLEVERRTSKSSGLTGPDGAAPAIRLAAGERFQRWSSRNGNRHPHSCPLAMGRPAYHLGHRRFPCRRDPAADHERRRPFSLMTMLSNSRHVLDATSHNDMQGAGSLDDRAPYVHKRTLASRARQGESVVVLHAARTHLSARRRSCSPVLTGPRV